MTTIQLIEDLKEDLELLGFPILVAQVDCIKATHLSEIKGIELFYLESLKYVSEEPDKIIILVPALPHENIDEEIEIIEVENE